jgi:two-component system, cell cycle sensor histidine kinase and response regulator CckA
MAIQRDSFECLTTVEAAAGQIEPFPEARKPRNARLSILLGPDKGQTFRVNDDCLVGRGPDSTICLTDRGVSRAHARVRRLADGSYEIQDLGSRNGTWVDGARASRQLLHAGAKIQIGPRMLLLFSILDENQEVLVEAKKAEIIGRLAAGINHDFNNLLCVVLANAAHLLELPQDVPMSRADVRECLDDMRAAAQAGAEVTSRLAALTQGVTLPQEMVDLSKLCVEMVEIMRETFPKTIRIEVKVEPGVQIRGIRSHLRQLLLNPCLNARDAMPTSGTLSIELVLKTAAELGAAPLMMAGYYAVLTFRDTGTGMTPSVLNRAFEPFFTTKEINLGRGLGLMSVRKIASDHGGTVDLQSKVGEGTMLRVVLPIDRNDHDGEKPEQNERVNVELKAPMETVRGPDGSERPCRSPDIARVLLAGVSDELGRALGRALRRTGCAPVSASTAADAIAQLASGAAYDIVLVDLDAPELAGLERTARALMPAAKLIGCTANAGQPVAAAAARSGVDYVLHKPVDLGSLAIVVALAMRTIRPAT